MNRKLLPIHLLIVAGSVGALMVSMVLHALLPDWRWHRESLHSAMESLGGLAAIAMAMVLLQKKEEAAGARLYPVALGFLGMGLLEEFHAVAAPGDGFILLRGMASLLGSIGFSLIWWPASPAARIRKPWLIAGASVAFGAWVIAFPELVPDMTRNGEFTPTAVAPQSFASMLFLTAAIRFASEYRRSGNVEDSLFACLAFLFGLAEVMFIYSTLWDSRWWLWHLTRLTAYLLALAHMVSGYRRMVHDLRMSLVQTTRAEETLRESEQHLRRVLEERERMAQDLHDGIIQSIFALGLNLERCQRLVTKDPHETITQLGAAVADLKSVIRDLRGYIIGLEPEVANGRHLEGALASLAKTLESSDFHCLVQIDPAAADRVTPEQARHIVYVAREAMSNSLRHAKARTEIISLQQHDDGVRLVVEDDGVGFNPDAVDGRGEGLRNMAARAKKLGARFAVVSETGQGTRITFDIPVERVHA
ncbi:MAG TPA: sensor histidine kinase [Nitrospiraceae bacterium]|nr:sensor histidine kinase [Nitrospiraceae bacterium]